MKQHKVISQTNQIGQIHIFPHFFFEIFQQIRFEIFCGDCVILELVNVTPHERVEMIWVLKKQINTKEVKELVRNAVIQKST